MTITTDTQMGGTGVCRCWANGTAGVLPSIVAAPTSTARTKASGAADGAGLGLKALVGAIRVDPGADWVQQALGWGGELNSAVLMETGLGPARAMQIQKTHQSQLKE